MLGEKSEQSQTSSNIVQHYTTSLIVSFKWVKHFASNNVLCLTIMFDPLERALKSS